MVKKILFIDDEIDLLSNIKKFFSQKGFAVTTAINGAIGIDILKKETFPLIITDLIMPEADGFEVLKYVKTNLPNSFIIVLTGYNTIDSVSRSIKSNTFDYVTKPFDCNHLLLSVSRAFNVLHLKKVQLEAEKKIKKLITVDELTGLLNTKCFYSVLSKEIKRANRYKQNLTLVTVDIENFSRAVNTADNKENNKIFKRVGILLKRSVRDIDSCYRIGDERFAVLLPETGIKKAKIAARRINTAIDTLWKKKEIEQKRLYPVKIGIAEYKKGHGIKDFVRSPDIIIPDK